MFETLARVDDYKASFKTESVFINMICARLGLGWVPGWITVSVFGGQSWVKAKIPKRKLNGCFGCDKVDRAFGMLMVFLLLERIYSTPGTKTLAPSRRFTAVQFQGR